MNCHYCNLPCINPPIITGVQESSWSCYSCNTHYHTDKINMTTTLNGRKVCLQFQLYDNAADLFYTDGCETIIKFNHLPNITPQNIKEKLKLYLLFS